MKVEVARVSPTGATDVEPQRAFLQDRLGLWAFWVFILSFGFYVTNMATGPFVRPGAPRVADLMLQAGNLDHLAASLVFGALWILTRRVRLSMRALRWLDLSALVVGCTLFALMGAYLMRVQIVAGLDVAIGAYSGLLACANTVMARAIAVPSTPRRTLVGSAASMAALVPATVFARRRIGGRGCERDDVVCRVDSDRDGGIPRDLRSADGGGARAAPRPVHPRAPDRRRRHGRRLPCQPRHAAAADRDQAAATAIAPARRASCGSSAKCRSPRN